MRIFTGRRHHIEHLAISPNGEFIACSGYISGIWRWIAQVWQVNGDGRSRHGVDGQLKQPPFTSDGRQLLVRSSDRSVTLDLATGEVSSAVPAREKPIEVSPDGRWSVEIEDDSEPPVLRLRGVEEGVERWQCDIPYPAVGEAGSANLLSVRFVVNGTRILVVFRRTEGFRVVGVSIRVIDTETSFTVAEWQGEHPTLSGPGGQLVFLDGSSFRVIDTSRLEQPAVVRKNTSHKHFTAAAFSPDGKLLATTSNDTTVTIWDTATWEPIRRYGWKIGRLRAVAFAPDGLTCAAGSDTGKVVLFDVDG